MKKLNDLFFYEPDGVTTGTTPDATTPTEQTTTDTNTAPVVPEELIGTLEKYKKGFATVQSNYDKLLKEKQELDNKLKKQREETLTEKQLKELRDKEFEDEINLKKKELETERLNFEKTKIIAEKQWNIDLIDLIKADDIDSFKENSEKFLAIVKKQVEKEVNERIAKVSAQNQTQSPKKNVPEDIFTIDEINKMTQDQIYANYDKVMKSIQFNKGK